MVDDKLGCLRCGQCCWYVMYNENEEPYLKRCKYLVRLRSGTTICKIYAKRKLLRTQNGIKIDSFVLRDEPKSIYCMWRGNGQFDYDGCPFNDGKKPNYYEHCKQLGVITK